MDRALKERIVGATVLVIVAVLVVPVFLDGSPTNAPADAPMIEQRIDLPGQQSDDSVRTVVLDRDRSEPLPARQTDANREAEDEPASVEAESPAAGTADAPAAAPVPVAAAPTPAPSEDEEPAEEPPTAEAADEPEEPPPADAGPNNRSATGMWAVQLGSFSNQANADRLAAELRQQGFAAFLSRLQTPNGQLHRVRVGPQRDRASAEAMAVRLERAGQKGQVVPHP